MRILRTLNKNFDHVFSSADQRRLSTYPNIRIVPSNLVIPNQIINPFDEQCRTQRRKGKRPQWRSILTIEYVLNDSLCKCEGSSLNRASEQTSGSEPPFIDFLSRSTCGRANVVGWCAPFLAIMPRFVEDALTQAFW